MIHSVVLVLPPVSNNIEGDKASREPVKLKDGEGVVATTGVTAFFFPLSVLIRPKPV